MILSRHPDAKIIWHDQHPNAIGCKRASLHDGKVHMHERTQAGWEDRPLDEQALSLLRTALVGVSVTHSGACFADGPWCCAFLARPGGRWEEHWAHDNSIGEPVTCAEEAVPLPARCMILAKLITSEQPRPLCAV